MEATQAGGIESAVECRPSRAGSAVAGQAVLGARYEKVRAATESLCEPLATEDYVIQSMPDASPTKWHLAHTSWFFDTFLLAPHARGYQPFDPHYSYLFNSYYVAVGDRHCRQNRGLLSRPTVSDVYKYRRYVDEAVRRLLEDLPENELRSLAPLIELGLHHEQQHQELMLTDIKHVFWVNPLRPAYRRRPPAPATQSSATQSGMSESEGGMDESEGGMGKRSRTRRSLPVGEQAMPRLATGKLQPGVPGSTLAHATLAEPEPMRWLAFDGGVQWIGHEGPGFAFDNESPRHRVLLEPFRLASRLVTNGEYLAFIDDGGYTRAGLWLSDGWATVQQEQWEAPLYWIRQDGRWWQHTLAGLRPVEPSEPVCHVSFFEADAFARWAGARLPTEAEWEMAAATVPVEGNFVEAGLFHPAPAPPGETGLRQIFGDLWQWTASAYLGYPGYRPLPGAIGEYNGKFMCNQFVLRGASCATPRSHARRSYRNFFAPHTRWQFAGIRLAEDAA